MLQLELQKSRASSKKTIVKIEDRIIDAGDDLLELRTNLAAVESVIGREWCPLKVIEAEQAIEDKENDIKELEELVDKVKAKVKEYIG